MSFYIDDYMDDRGLVTARSVGELICECPQCGKQKLYVNASKKVWQCFYCDDGGGQVALVALVEGVSLSRARRIIQRHRGRVRRLKTEMPLELDIVEKKKGPEVWPPEGWIPCWDGLTWCVPEYLNERGVTWKVAHRYNLGYCDKGRYRNRLILPVKMNGKTITWQARAMLPIKPKYLHPVGAPKGIALFGYDQAMGAEKLVVCEGPFDVLALAQHGVSAIALMGKVCSKRQAMLIRDIGASEIVVMMDGDEAGLKAAPKVVKTLRALVPKTRFVKLPPDVDAAEMDEVDVVSAIENAKELTVKNLLTFT